MKKFLCLVTLFLPDALSAAPQPASISLRDLATECRCKLGVAAQIVEDPGRKWVNTSSRFPTASTYKLPIAAAFLHLVDDGRFHLDHAVEVLPQDIIHGVSELAETHPAGGMLKPAELLRLMIVTSDNSASDAILRLSGGPQAVTTWLRHKGIDGLDVSTSERNMDQRQKFLTNSTTPMAMVTLLAKLQRGELVSASSTAFLLDALTQTKTFPGRIKGMLPPGTPVAHKTGTGGRHNRVNWAANDVGLIELPGGRGHLAIAVYLQDTPLSDKNEDAVIARVTKRVWDAWSH